MIQKIKHLTLLIATLVASVIPVAAPVSVYAANTIQEGFCKGTEDLEISTTGKNCTTSTLNENTANATLKKVINVVSAVVGVIAVLMIVFGGFKYITSGGDSSKVGSAKTTILYALIGLVIVAIAQLIVRFVVSNAVTTTGGTL